MRQITQIIIHCSATPEGKDYTVADIDRWHKARGFKMIGYHYVIYRDGSIHTGRPLEMVGAHCTGHNTHSIGICYIGGIAPNGRAKDTRTPAQKEALRKLIYDLRHQPPSPLIPHPSSLEVHGHREFANKDCPCFDVQEEF